MKKSISILTAIALIAFLGFAFTPNKEIQTKTTVHTETEVETGIKFFKGTWEEALAKAKKENKIIFLDAYAVWCGPCKILAKRTFTQKEVGDFFNANFINYKMDMEKHKDGPRLARKLRLTHYPTLYFLDASENVAKSSMGLIDGPTLVSIGKSVIK